MNYDLRMQSLQLKKLVIVFEKKQKSWLSIMKLYVAQNKIVISRIISADKMFKEDLCRSLFSMSDVSYGVF